MYEKKFLKKLLCMLNYSLNKISHTLLRILIIRLKKKNYVLCTLFVNIDKKNRSS